MNLRKIGAFAGGVLFGTARVKILSSKDAKKAYTHCTAAVLRAKDSVMKTVTTARTMALSVDKVWKQCEDTQVQVDINKIRLGDYIVVRDSDIIPLDGRIVSGEMTVNQSSMTGESEPVFKQEGSYAYAGTIVEEGECVIEVTKIAGSGKYDQIVHMIEDSQKLSSNTETAAYHLADKMVPYSFMELVTLRRLSSALIKRINKNYRFIFTFNSALIGMGLCGVITPSASAPFS